MNATTKHLHTLPFWDHLSNAEKDILCNNAYIRSFDRDSYTAKSATKVQHKTAITGKHSIFLEKTYGFSCIIYPSRGSAAVVISAQEYCIIYSP